MRRFKACIFLLGVLPFLAAAPARAQETRITIGIECGAQGIVDDDWTMEFDLYNGDTKVNTDPIVISVKDGTGAAAVAERLAIVINLHADPKTPASTVDTTHQRYNGEGSRVKARDVILKEGFKIKNVRTTKKTPDNEKKGHFKVFEGKTQLNNKAKAKAAEDASDEPLTLVIDLHDYVTPALGIDLLFGGTDAAGTAYVHDLAAVFPGRATPAEVTAAIGAWASEALGIVADYPSPTSVRLFFEASGITPDWWSFTAYVTQTDDLPGDTSPRYVEFTAD